MVKIKNYSWKQRACAGPLAPYLLAFAGILLLSVSRLEAQDPNDPFSAESDFTFQGPLSDENQDDSTKSVDQLLLEGDTLYRDERLLDARTKWLKVLEKDPKEYRAHIMLSTYYLAHVGHFRLALKYAKQALALFEEQKGKPPYQGFEEQLVHAQLLSILSQARLNLDDYVGALSTLDQLKEWGYASPWYSGSRAWILMKMGKLQEAIGVARQGYLFMTDRREKGQLLNMLGILLSMDNQRQNALQIFEQAIRHEFSQGEQGEPATPLNNSGEVYKEIFEDDKAETSWLKAVSLPDGCEHVLPSLNLSLLYIDQLNLPESKNAMDRFEACVAKFPLRNGEEHRALVHLARGRIDLLSGKIDLALEHFEAALNRQQWFGKIGTNPEDLQAGALSSLAAALEAKRNWLRSQLGTSLKESLQLRWQRSLLGIRAWWSLRRAKQILAEDLNNLEDLSVRHTDSLLEYPTLGTILSRFSRRQATRRIEAEMAGDSRAPAAMYYRAYLGESALRASSYAQAQLLLKEVLSKARPRLDAYLLAHARLLLLERSDSNGTEYQDMALQVYRANRALLRNRGLCLPINLVDTQGALAAALKNGPFCVVGSRKLPLSLAMEGGQILFDSELAGIPSRTKSIGEDPLPVALNQLADTVFQQELGN